MSTVTGRRAAAAAVSHFPLAESGDARFAADKRRGPSSYLHDLDFPEDGSLDRSLPVGHSLTSPSVTAGPKGLRVQAPRLKPAVKLWPDGRWLRCTPHGQATALTPAWQQAVPKACMSLIEWHSFVG